MDKTFADELYEITHTNRFKRVKNICENHAKKSLKFHMTLSMDLLTEDVKHFFKEEGLIVRKVNQTNYTCVVDWGNVTFDSNSSKWSCHLASLSLEYFKNFLKKKAENGFTSYDINKKFICPYLETWLHQNFRVENHVYVVTIIWEKLNEEKN